MANPLRGLRFSLLDFHSARSNIGLKIAMLGIALIPLVYGALYLMAFYDPYGKLDTLPVAVVNEDVPYTTDSGKKVSAGDDLVDKLKDSDALDWRFVNDPAVAEAGLEDGTYYNVVTIPADFSQKIASADGDNPQQARLVLRTNDANNYLSSILGASVMRVVTAETNYAIGNNYYVQIFDSIDETGDSLKEASDGAGKLASGIGDAHDGSQKITDGLGAAQSGSVALAGGLVDARDGSRTIASGLGAAQLGSEALATGVGTAKQGADQLAQGTRQLSDGAAAAKAGSSDLAGGIAQLADGSSALTEGLADAKDGSDALAAGMGSLQAGSDALATGLSSAKDGSSALADGLSDLVAGSDQLSGGIQAAATGAEDLKAGLDELDAGATQLSTGASQLVGALDAKSASGELDQLDGGAQQLADGLSQMYGSMSDLVYAAQGASQCAQAAYGALISVAPAEDGTYVQDGAYVLSADQMAQVLKAVDDAAQYAGGAADGAVAAQQASSQLSDGASAVSGGVGELVGSIEPGGQLYEAAAALSSGASELAAGISQADSGAGALAQGVAQVKGGSDALAQGIASAKGGADSLATGIEGAYDGSSALAQGITSAKAGADTLSAGIGVARDGSEAVAAGLGDARTGSAALDAGVGQLADGLAQGVAGSGQLASGLGQLSAGAQSLTSGLGDLHEGSESLASGLANAQSGSADLEDGLTQLSSGSAALTSGLVEARDGSRELADGLADGVDAVAQATTGSDARATMMSEPVELEESHYTTVPNYGSGFAPYFIALGLWVGSLVMTFIFRPLNERLIIGGANPVVAAFAGLAPWLILGAVQALLLAATIQFACGISVAHPLAYYLLAVLASFVFCAMVQAISAIFGFPGKFVAVVLLMLQLTTAAGTFPIETEFPIFQAMSPYLPMTYVVRALRQAMAGADLSLVGPSVWALVTFMVVSFALTSVVAWRKRLVTMSDLHPLVDL